MIHLPRDLVLLAKECGMTEAQLVDAFVRSQIDLLLDVKRKFGLAEFVRGLRESNAATRMRECDAHNRPTEETKDG